jgi:Domain of unknown function (DUF222)/HNH endonuclease
LSELRSAVEALRSETLPDLPDARLEDDFTELQRVCEQLELERLRRLAEIERRRLFERDGHLSAASWLATRFRVAWGTARGQTHLARALTHMPATRRALEAGDVSLSAACVLVAARDANPDAFDRSEVQLVDAARIHTINDLQRVASFWRQRVERDRLDDRLRARRRLHASVSFEGMVRVDGDLDPEAGETLLTALRAVMDAGSRNGSGGDDRTPPQRRADALHEICRQWLDLADRPSVAGERPHVAVTVDAPALAGASSGAGDLDRVGAVDVTVARQLSCDASVMRVVMAGRSQPLDVGRRTPVVPPAVRRAVIVRDRTCRFPGCDRPHTWCDAHHVVHWTEGGSTSLQNLLLLCRRHHGMIHRREGFRLNLEDSVPVFRRWDGTVLENPKSLQRLAG